MALPLVPVSQHKSSFPQELEHHSLHPALAKTSAEIPHTPSSTLDCSKDKLSITTVIFIRSENNLALLWLYVLLGISECMLWIQSMPRVTCGHWGIVIGWNCLGKPLLCMYNGCWVESILRPGVSKRTLSHKWLRWYLTTFLFNDGLFTLM